VDVHVVDWDSIDHGAWRAEVLGEAPQPASENDPTASSSPLWQSCEGSGVFWDWLDTSSQPSHANPSWQCERLWQIHKTQARGNFGAILSLLEWEEQKMPVFSVVMCMTLNDSDGDSKKLLLLVEPSGKPRRWETFVIKRLRKCEYQECYRSRVVVSESPVFKDELQLRRTVGSILRFLPLRTLRLKDVVHGRLADLRTM
jgi:hypothetical protein